jgi:hypothetical protein
MIVQGAHYRIATRPLLAVRCFVVIVAMVFPQMICAKESHPMKVKLQQSGGYTAPIGQTTCEFDTHAMAAAEAEALRSLVQTSGLLESRQTVWKAPRGADLITYVLTIEEAEGSHQFAFDELSVPAAAAPLLDYLLDHCP